MCEQCDIAAEKADEDRRWLENQGFSHVARIGLTVELDLFFHPERADAEAFHFRTIRPVESGRVTAVVAPSHPYIKPDDEMSTHFVLAALAEFPAHFNPRPMPEIYARLGVDDTTMHAVSQDIPADILNDIKRILKGGVSR